MRLVLDTNVLISALVFPGGPPEVIYQFGIQRRVQLVTSIPLLTELARVLGEKFARDERAVREVVSQVARASDIVEPSETVNTIKDDPADNRVLEAADAGKVDVIISGDHHLLDLGTWHTIPIEDPASFLRREELE